MFMVLKYLIYNIFKKVKTYATQYRDKRQHKWSGIVSRDLLGEMFLQVLGHAEALNLLGSEHLGHRLVRGEVLPVLGVLEVVLLQVGPQPFGDLQKISCNVRCIKNIHRNKKINFGLGKDCWILISISYHLTFKFIP